MSIGRWPFFYGWVILAVGSLGIIMTSPGQTYAVSMFIDYFIEDLGTSRTVVSTLYSGATLLGSFGLPAVGRLIDRHGCRRTVTVISLLFGLACCWMGAVTNLFMLALGFLSIRLLGQGSLSLVSGNVINQWWVRRRGTVMGLAGMISALLGAGMFPPVINRLIPILGWRATFLALGLVLVTVMLPLGAVFFRDRPEDHGLLPDGELLPEKATTQEPGGADWSRDEALTTGTFWIAAAGLSAIAMVLTGLHFHSVSLFTSQGLERSTAADLFFPIALTASLTTLISGIVKDRIPVRFLLALALFFQGSALLLGRSLEGSVLLYGLILGATGGLFRTVSGVIWADLFGRTHLGSISGVATTLIIAGSSFGPLPFGAAFEYFGSYSQVLLVSAVLPFGLALASLFMPNPRRSG